MERLSTLQTKSPNPNFSFMVYLAIKRQYSLPTLLFGSFPIHEMGKDILLPVSVQYHSVFDISDTDKASIKIEIPFIVLK